MTTSTIALLGGSGFIGSVLANQLVASGYAVRVLTRRRSNAREVWLLPNTDVVEVDPLNAERLKEHCDGCSTVINLIGILNERGDNGAGFRRAHVEVVQNLIKACKSAGVARLIQMSALNADSFAASHYLRSKGEAEKLIADEAGQHLSTSVFRPSLVFGPHDDFTNRFARLLKFAPGFLPLAAGDTRVQPVYVNDLASALMAAIANPANGHQRYDIGGPEIVTLTEVVKYIGSVIGSSARIIGLGSGLSKLQANVLEFVPGKPFSRDNLRSLQEDSVCMQANALDQFGISTTPMRVVVPGYLGQTNLRQRYYEYRSEAGRG
jgi:nucleoside-diphosphate-sugar epimerase